MGIGNTKQVRLKRYPVTTGADGRQVEFPTADIRLWAEVSNPSGFRDYEHGQTQLGDTRVFKVNFRFDKFPGADWTLTYLGKDYTITNIRRVDENKFYWLITGTAKLTNAN